MPDPSETLCLACGMCCDGTLHNFTFLRESEETRARKLGLRVRKRRDGIPLFLQPCTAFQAPLCVIYAQRPHACRQYKCKLLVNMEEGSVSVQDALETARRTRELIDALRNLMPDPDPHLSLDQQVKTNWSAAQPLPEDVQPIFDELRSWLHVGYGVRWKRDRSRFQRWMKKMEKKE